MGILQPGTGITKILNTQAEIFNKSVHRYQTERHFIRKAHLIKLLKL